MAEPAQVPDGVKRYFFLLDRYGKEYDVNPLLLGAVMEQESGGNPLVIGPLVDGQHAEGAMQFLPSTASAYKLKNPFAVAQSVKAAADMLHGFFAQGMSVQEALAHYGGKPGNPLDTQYVNSVLANYQTFSNYVKRSRPVDFPPSVEQASKVPMTPAVLAARPYDHYAPSNVPYVPPLPGGESGAENFAVPPLQQEIQNYKKSLPPPAPFGVVGNVGAAFDHGLLQSMQEPIRMAYEAKEGQIPFTNIKSPILASAIGTAFPFVRMLPPHKVEQFIANSVDHYYNVHKLNKKFWTGEVPNFGGNAAGAIAAIESGDGLLDAATMGIGKLPLVGDKVASAAKAASEFLTKPAGKNATALAKLGRTVAQGVSQGAEAGVASTAKGQNIGQSARQGAVDGALGNVILGGAGKVAGFGGDLLSKLIIHAQGHAENAADVRAAERVLKLFPKGLGDAVATAKSYGPEGTLYDTPEGRDSLKKLVRQPYLNGVLHDFANSRRQTLTTKALESRFLGDLGQAGPTKQAAKAANEKADAILAKLSKHIRENPEDVHLSKATVEALVPEDVQTQANTGLATAKSNYGKFDALRDTIPDKLDPLMPADSLTLHAAVNVHKALENRLEELYRKGETNTPLFRNLEEAKDSLRADLDTNETFRKMMALSRSTAETNEAVDKGKTLINPSTPVSAVSDYVNRLLPEQRPVVLRSMVDAMHDKLFQSTKDAPQIASNMAKDQKLRSKLTAAVQGVPGLNADVVDNLFQHMQNVSHLSETAREATPKGSSEPDKALSPLEEAASRVSWESIAHGTAGAVSTGLRFLGRFANAHKDIMGDHAFHRLMSLDPDEAQSFIKSVQKKPTLAKKAIEELGNKAHVAMAHALLEQNQPLPNPPVPPVPTISVPSFASMVPSAQAMGTAAGQGLPVGLPAIAQGSSGAGGAAANAPNAPIGQGMAGGLPIAARVAAPQAMPAPSGPPAPIGGIPALPVKPLTRGQAKIVKKLQDAQAAANSALPLNFNYSVTARAP